ncbi:MAG: hypothetical protein Q4A06_00270 [Cardiobacteriaceae bacterium]|nr:hypothetical protein [Cardiobacteriaceae bacterium]
MRKFLKKSWKSMVFRNAEPNVGRIFHYQAQCTPQAPFGIATGQESCEQRCHDGANKLHAFRAMAQQEKCTDKRKQWPTVNMQHQAVQDGCRYMQETVIAGLPGFMMQTWQAHAAAAEKTAKPWTCATTFAARALRANVSDVENLKRKKISVNRHDFYRDA